MNIVAVFDPTGKIPQTSRANDYAGIKWEFVEQVPYIQDAMGWIIGAEFQRKWLTGESATATRNLTADLPNATDLPNAEPGTLRLDDTTIKLSWVFDHRNCYDDRAYKIASELLLDFFTTDAKTDPKADPTVRTTLA